MLESYLDLHLSIMSYTKTWDANRIGTELVMAKVSSQYLFKSGGGGTTI